MHIAVAVAMVLREVIVMVAVDHVAVDRSDVCMIEVIAAVARSRLDLLHAITTGQYPASIGDELLGHRLAVSRRMAAVLLLLLLHMRRGVVHLVPAPRTGACVGGRVQLHRYKPSSSSSSSVLLLLLLLADGQVAEVGIKYVG